MNSSAAVQNPKIGFVFPGQGSQSVGMLSDLSRSHPQVKETFAEASAVVALDLWALVENGPKETLDLTQNTQPIMLAAGAAVWRVWQGEGGPTPLCMAGHSLGEYTALVCAGALDFSTAIELVAARARFMQEAVPEGAGGMAAILGMTDEAVRELCLRAAEGEVLEAVNFNAPSQVVVAGAANAVARAVAQAGAAGAKRAVVLPVSVPSHCDLMRPAAERLAKHLQEVSLHRPRIPVLHNVHVRAETDPDAIHTALVRQLYSPVRWVETIEKITAQGVDRLVECGPGRVLTGLNKRINRNVPTLPVFDPRTLQQALSELA